MGLTILVSREDLQLYEDISDAYRLERIFGEKLLAASLEFLDKDLVKVVECQSSARQVYELQSSSSTTDLHFVLGRHYCSCPAFHFEVLTQLCLGKTERFVNGIALLYLQRT